MNYRHQASETRYRELGLRTDGRAVDWAGKSFDDFDLRPFLEQTLPTLRFTAHPPRALEYGTGTGAGACFLAQRGFAVDAIDVSPAAIELARTFAAARGANVTFSVHDICTLSVPDRSYDLIVDNFCLHCLVTDEERAAAFKVVRSALKPHGWFLIGTAVYRDDRDLGGGLLDPATGTVYRLLDDPRAAADAVRRDGRWYAPCLRYVRADYLRGELEANGFVVQWQHRGRVVCAVAPCIDAPDVS